MPRLKAPSSFPSIPLLLLIAFYATSARSSGEDSLVPATSASFARNGVGIQDASEVVRVKSNSWTTNARIAYLRFPLTGEDEIGGLAADDLLSASLEVFVTTQENGDTITVYGLLDGAQATGALSETSWTGGSDGSSGGGNNLSAANRPDGNVAVPNPLTTVSLGSFTYATDPNGNDDNDLGLKKIDLSSLPAFQDLVRNDTNQEITLIIRGEVGGRSTNFASTYNTSGQPVPVLRLSDSPVVTSSLVALGPGGLEYTSYANQGQTNAVNTVPDFSKAGYQGGGVPIPFVPTRATVVPGPGDDTSRIQQAIDTVSALTPDASGFRGAVLIKAGDYTVGSPLAINTSGVVIRGEGSQENGGTRITYTATSQSNLFQVAGSGPGLSEIGGSRVAISDSYVPVGSMTLAVADASGFSVGNRIVIENTTNQQWLDDMSNMSQWGWSVGGYQLEFRRTITAINGNELTLDAPIVQAIETQYGGGEVYRYTFNRELENIGFEALRLESSFASETDENHGWIAIRIDGVRNGWVRQVTALYFGYGLVTIDSQSQQITVEDCAMLEPKSVITGGRRYSFNIDDSEFLLFQRCLARQGRHDFVSGSRTHGPNVFVDSRAVQANSDIGPHQRYATGQNYDNILTDGAINVQNRRGSGSGHGWAGAQIMFWNNQAASLIADAPTGAMNWSVGSVGAKTSGSAGEPFGIWDSENQRVQPRSLFYAQLEERLGTNALNDTILPLQKFGPIWTDLLNWNGDGLLLDRLLAWADEETIPATNSPLAIRGAVRDLLLMENLTESLWTKVSGPGNVIFADPSELATTATFDQPGSYLLALTATDGISPATASLHLIVDGISLDTTPPGAPANLSATAGAGSIVLDWDDNTGGDLSVYSVYRTSFSGVYGPPLLTGITESQFTDRSAIDGTTYFYTVTATDHAGNESDQSLQSSATPSTPNLPPSGEFVTPFQGESFPVGTDLYVRVEASDPDGLVDSIRLRLDGDSAGREGMAPYEWSGGILANLAAGTYLLEAEISDNQGGTSFAFISILIGDAPSAPSDLVATAVSGPGVTLTWNDNSGNETGFEIQRDSGSGFVTIGTAAVDATSFSDSGLSDNAIYSYRLSATGGSGNSLASTTVGVTTWTAAESWRYQFFGQIEESGIASETSDPDQDGVVNLLERALGTSPSDGDSHSLPFATIIEDNDSSHLAITYRRLTGGSGATGIDYTVDGLRFQVQYDDDLAPSWSTGDITEVGTASDNGDGTETVTIRLTESMTLHDHRFIRLAVSRVP